MIILSENKQLETHQAKPKCFVCNKRLGLLDFKCTCEKSLCARHRYPETHDCTHDFLSKEIEKLKENNPIIMRPRIEKI